MNPQNHLKRAMNWYLAMVVYIVVAFVTFYFLSKFDPYNQHQFIDFFVGGFGIGCILWTLISSGIATFFVIEYLIEGK